MKTTMRLILSGLIIISVAFGCERKVTNSIVSTVPVGSASYVGSDACEACHATIHASFMKTGHPFKLNNAAEAQVPGYYPFTTVVNPPDLPWSNIDLVIGGFWWKARYISNESGHEGQVFTGPDRQYNLRIGNPEGPEFVKYETDNLDYKDYDCGPCHMTGYKSGGNQDGKPGLIGTWAANGIQCEECHGPGELHVDAPTDVAMIVDRSNALCGKCHIRGPVNKIPASGGFIRHHEQWNEMFTTKHNGLQCVTCHEPHIGLHPLNADRFLAIRINCESCHFKETAAFINSDIGHYDQGVMCINCHMPYAAKSATGDLANFTGDIRSHLWRINIESNAQMFTPDGKFANGYLTVEYSCKPCHPSESTNYLTIAAEDVHPLPSSIQ